MAVLSDTLEVAETHSAPIFSIGVGEDVLTNEAVPSNGHIHARSAEIGPGGQRAFVTRVLRAILTILKARRVGR